MLKKNWIYILFGFAVILFVITRFTKKVAKHPDEIAVTLKTYETSFGWGYDIYTNDSLYIHQEYMPAVEGRKGFANKEDADKIGQLAIARLKYSKLPVITLADLDSIGIKR